MRNPRAAIITAIPAELEALRELLELEDFTDPADGSVYFKGILACDEERDNCAREWEIFLPMPSEAGNVLSGVTTSRVVNMIEPDVTLFVGCAGGIPGKVNPYDVVVGSRIYYYEPGRSTDDSFPGRILPGRRASFSSVRMRKSFRIAGCGIFIRRLPTKRPPRGSSRSPPVSS